MTNPEYYAVNFQEENWEDDGGDHDVVIIDMAALKETEPGIHAKIMEGQLLTDDEVDKIGAVDAIEMPISIMGIKSIWWSFL